jgi:hypothetical protein
MASVDWTRLRGTILCALTITGITYMVTRNTGMALAVGQILALGMVWVFVVSRGTLTDSRFDATLDSDHRSDRTLPPLAS